MKNMSKRFCKPIIVSFAILLFLTGSCENGDKDMEKPVIDNSFAGAFPKNCDTIYTGQTFYFRARFTDNAGLGSFSIHIHNNFDHHSHSTDVEACSLDPVKIPENPFSLIEGHDIPHGLKKYEADVAITVPPDVDTGDYHFFISLTDVTGWRAEKGISIKIGKQE